MFADIYKNKKIFITGHTGFKGSWLTAWLLSLGAYVTGFSLDVPSEPANFNVLKLDSKINDLRGDVRNGKALADAVISAQPDVIFHLAAQALVRESYANPVDTFETNMLGTMNILEAARNCSSVSAIVIITSDKCYRNEEWVWGYRETDHLGGYDPYSASKGCAEIIAHSYFKSFFQTGPACATVRAGNVIGGGDWAKDRIVPDCARAWAKRQPVEIRSPLATRPWQLVLEPLSGYLWLGVRLLNNDIRGKGIFNPRGQAYNFGPAADVNNTVAEVVNALASYWPDFSFVMDQGHDRTKKECELLKLCCDKSLAELDWKATLTFPETIKFTAQWYANYYNNHPSMWDLTLEQIQTYASLAKQRNLLWAKD